MRIARVMLLAGTVLAMLALVGCAEESTPDRWVVEELGTHADFRDIFFLDAERGWMVGGGFDIGGGILGSTVDGGRTWTFESAIVPPPAKPSSFRLNGVWFLDPDRGFAVGDGFHVLRTIDGGQHWHRVTRARGGGSWLQDVQFVDDRHGWVVGTGGLMRTVDGGETWQTPRDPGEDGRTPRTTGLAMHFLDRDRGFLVDKFGVIRATTDGGASWTTLRGPRSGREDDLWGLDFVDGSHGWAVGAGGTILHTPDGGLTWRRQRSGVRDMLMDVDFLDASRGFAVGFDRETGTAVILRTADGGANWTVDARVATEALHAIHVLDGSHAWAVGEQQRRSADDGSQKLLRYEVVEAKVAP